MSDTGGMAALDGAVTAFVDGVTPLVEELAASVEGVRPDRLRDDVVVEAFNLACAFVDADGLHTDDELWALAAAFGPHMATGIGRSRPADIRNAGLLTGRKAWLHEPSTLLGVLADADARTGGSRALAYARLGAQVGHVVASLDLVPSRTELLAIDRFRTTVHGAMDDARAKVSRGPGAPGGPATPAGPGDADGAAAAGTVSTASAATAAATEAATAAEEERPPPRPIDELLAELDALIGLDAVKREVRLVANLLRVEQLRRERELPVLGQSRHLVFTGNPGTGKTTVARLLAEIYRTLGVVARGHLVETDRSGLVAGFVGQTAPRVVAAFDRADEGVLLVDEAYSLARGGENDFGREAIDTIVKLVEDRRDQLVVILAGYPDEMAELVAANPGMRSRFPRTIHFPDYDDDELVAILASLGEKGRYHLDEGAREAARAFFAAQPRDRGFGNGRLARNVFEAAVAHQASRLVEIEAPTDEQLTTLTASDITGGEADGAEVAEVDGPGAGDDPADGADAGRTEPRGQAGAAGADDPAGTGEGA